MCDSTLYKTLESEKISVEINYSDHKKISKTSIFGNFTLLGDCFWVLGGEVEHGSLRIYGNTIALI